LLEREETGIETHETKAQAFAYGPLAREYSKEMKEKIDRLFRELNLGIEGIDWFSPAMNIPQKNEHDQLISDDEMVDTIPEKKRSPEFEVLPDDLAAVGYFPIGSERYVKNEIEKVQSQRLEMN
jgi:hypothetical protein